MYGIKIILNWDRENFEYLLGKGFASTFGVHSSGQSSTLISSILELNSESQSISIWNIYTIHDIFKDKVSIFINS